MQLQNSQWLNPCFSFSGPESGLACLVSQDRHASPCKLAQAPANPLKVACKASLAALISGCLFAAILPLQQSLAVVNQSHCIMQDMHRTAFLSACCRKWLPRFLEAHSLSLPRMHLPSCHIAVKTKQRITCSKLISKPGHSSATARGSQTPRA